MKRAEDSLECKQLITVSSSRGNRFAGSDQSRKLGLQ